MTSLDDHVLAEWIRINRHQVNPFIGYVYWVLLLVSYLIFIFTFTFVLVLILKFIDSLVVVGLEVGLFLFGALLAAVGSSELVDLVQGHRPHAENVHATPGDVLLTVPEVVLREHVALAGAEEEGGLAVWVGGVEGADRRLGVVEIVLARLPRSRGVRRQNDFAIRSRVMRLLPFGRTRTLLLANISCQGGIGVL